MKNWIPTTISVVALGIAIVAIAKVSPTQVPLDFDYYGAIIGVLSFLVTLLMGYQIYTVINVKKELEDVQSLKEEIDSTLKAKVDQLTKNNQEELAHATNVLIAMLTHDKRIIVKALFKAYMESKPNQLARDLANKSILTILEGCATITDVTSRRASLEELSRNVKHEDVVEFYTDYAKNGNKTDFKDVESVILELLAILAEKNNDGVEN